MGYIFHFSFFFYLMWIPLHQTNFPWIVKVLSTHWDIPLKRKKIFHHFNYMFHFCSPCCICFSSLFYESQFTSPVVLRLICRSSAKHLTPVETVNGCGSATQGGFRSAVPFFSSHLTRVTKVDISKNGLSDINWESCACVRLCSSRWTGEKRKRGEGEEGSQGTALAF